MWYEDERVVEMVGQSAIDRFLQYEQSVQDIKDAYHMDLISTNEVIEYGRKYNNEDER